MTDAAAAMASGTGRCLCGAVTYAFDAAPNWQAYCHCESCRRNCSAPYTAYFAISHGHWRWTGTTPAVYASSPGVRRHFCARCGTPMAFEGDLWAHELHFYAASLDDPTAYQPTAHANWNEHLPWVKLADGLKLLRTPRRMSADEDFAPLLGLVQSAFASMKGRIDPPSSANRLTADNLAEQARTGEVWVMEDLGQPVACMVLTPKADHLYLGKLATDPAFRHQKLARQLIRHAESRARALALPELRLETRVELTENHATFRALGFTETARSAHPGFERPTSVTFSKAVR